MLYPLAGGDTRRTQASIVNWSELALDRYQSLLGGQITLGLPPLTHSDDDPNLNCAVSICVAFDELPVPLRIVRAFIGQARRALGAVNPLEA